MIGKDTYFPKQAFSRLEDKKIVIYAKQTVNNEQGFAVVQWKPIHDGKLWACYRSLSGAECWQSVNENHIAEAIFNVNWRRDIAPGMRVVFRDKVYEIIWVDDLQGNKGDLKLCCKWLQGEKLEGYE